MAVKRFGLTGKIVSLAVVPLIILSVFISILIGRLSYDNLYNEVSHEMKSVCVSVYELLDANEGYQHERYDFFSESGDIFDEITRSTGIEITLFEGDLRRITTVTDSSGERVVGTKAAIEVVDAVIDGGSDFFSDNVDVNGSEYFGYYMPIVDNNAVTGMVFAGKNRQEVVGAISSSVTVTLLMSWLITIIAAAICVAVSKRMVKSLRSAANFLRTISLGNTECIADDDLVSRNDEIGDMGRSAVTLQTALRNLISNDPLTGLYNRRACNIKMTDMYNSAQKDKIPFVVAIGDIDLFKRFNDNYGHACGDLVLKDIARLLSDGVGSMGIVSRWGGEEFLLAFGGIPYEQALAAVNKIMDNIHSYLCNYNGKEISVTMTFGIQEYVSGSIDALINAADKKLYYGKNNGRDCVVEKIPDEQAVF